jgi:hypothetical protein
VKDGRHANPKTVVLVEEERDEPETDGGATEPAIEVESAAAQNARVSFICSWSLAAIFGIIRIRLIQTVSPFPYIARHIGHAVRAIAA